MKKKIIILLAVVLAAGAPLVPSAKAIDFSISVGDRGYYYGPSYWHEGYRWVWVPGYRHRGRWIHGHYERRGRWYLAHSRARHRHHRHWDRSYDRHDDRDYDRDRGRSRY